MNTITLPINKDLMFEDSENEETDFCKISFSLDLPRDSIHGIYCGIMERDIDSATYVDEIDEFCCSNYWFFVPTKEMFEKLPRETKYLVYFPQMENYGVCVAVKNIKEFLSGLTSFSWSFPESSVLGEVFYLNLKKRNYEEMEECIENIFQKYGKPAYEGIYISINVEICRKKNKH